VIAALPMYDRPEIAAATDRLWAAIAARLRARGIAAPERLTRGGDPWALWQSPDLLLAQTCGLPFRARLAGRVRLVGTPDYGLPGCPPGHYRSVIVARGPDLPARPRLAYNEALSQSGWAAALDWAAGAGLRLGARVPTGAHAASLAAVARGAADLAALDAVTWRLLVRHDPAAAGVQVLARTRPTPGLPLITAAERDLAPLRAAVASAIAALSPPDRRATGLVGLVRIDADAYLALPIPPDPQACDDPTGA